MSLTQSLNSSIIEFNDLLKALFLLIMLPESSDFLKNTINSIASANGFSSTIVESSILIKEVHKRNVDTT